MNNTNEACEKCGKPMTLKEGKFGQFFSCTGYPDCNNTKPIHPHDQSNQPIQVPEEDKKCEKCGSEMVVKNGRYGPFLACSGYPDCRNIKNIEQKTGVKCPQCGQGDIIMKRSRQGKTFYSCNLYPTCKYALWAKPTGNKCPDCQSLMVQGDGNGEKCSNKTCKFEQTT